MPINIKIMRVFLFMSVISISIGIIRSMVYASPHVAFIPIGTSVVFLLFGLASLIIGDIFE